jgi:hypothetical protein
MSPYKKLVSSSIAFVSSQEGEMSKRMLAFHATSIVVVVCFLFALAAFAFAGLLVPDILIVGKQYGKWVCLLMVVVIWALQFPSVMHTVSAISEGKCARTTKSYAVWAMTAAFGAFFASIVATLAFN